MEKNLGFQAEIKHLKTDIDHFKLLGMREGMSWKMEGKRLVSCLEHARGLNVLCTLHDRQEGAIVLLD